MIAVRVRVPISAKKAISFALSFPVITPVSSPVRTPLAGDSALKMKIAIPDLTAILLEDSPGRIRYPNNVPASCRSCRVLQSKRNNRPASVPVRSVVFEQTLVKASRGQCGGVPYLLIRAAPVRAIDINATTIKAGARAANSCPFALVLRAAVPGCLMRLMPTCTSFQTISSGCMLALMSIPYVVLRLHIIKRHADVA
eukprot:scaffold56420_cov48-Attheya_sp.AAC.1